MAVPDTPAPSTYRLQCHAGFTLDDARRLVPYLGTLGVTHLYTSPLLHSRSGSTHGYDGVDPRAIDPELGGREALERLAGEAHRHGLRLLVDIVPNHLATSTENPAWSDVLCHGRSSRWARWFDIDWEPFDEDLQGRVLCPLLHAPTETALLEGTLSVVWEKGRFSLAYYEHRLPLSAASVPVIVAGPGNDGAEISGPELTGVLEALAKSPEPARCGLEDGALRDAAESLLERLGELAEEDHETATWLQRRAEQFGSGPDGPARLGDLLDKQAYRLVWWKEAARRINYRRFFDINELVCLRQEDPRVFEETHAILLELAKEGLVDGFRIDHIDGLLDPLGYLRTLREALAKARPGEPFPLYVEKIVAEGEHLPASWPVDGTTGYEFLNQVEHWLVSREGFESIGAFYREWTGRPESFPAIAEAGKRRVLQKELHAPAAALARQLAALAEDNGEALDPDAALAAVVEVITALPVYRTYVDGDTTTLEPAQEGHVRTALDRARQAGRATPDALAFLDRVLRLDHPSADPPAGWRDFVQCFQQLSGPAAAKGIEDTALYAHVPLASLNEVGGEPVLGGDDPAEALHEANRERAADFPRAMLAVSTHDTKRSADLRARLDVLSEIPDHWSRTVTRWRELNAAKRADETDAPDPGTEYLFYQSLLGLWPRSASGGPPQRPDADGLLALAERLLAYMEKAGREAKVHTSWSDPDPDFEAAVAAFVRAVLDPANTEFLEEVRELCTRIDHAACWNALSRTVLQFTSPGSPDLYQGDELWTLALVDPDNRRPVDFAQRSDLLDEIKDKAASPDLASLRHNPADPRLKLHVIRALLTARRSHPATFLSANYEPVAIQGPRADHLLAFLRVTADDALLVVVSRHTLGLPATPSEAPVGPDCWAAETRLVLPSNLGVARWDSLLGSPPVTHPGDSSPLPAAAFLTDLPVTVCHGRRT